MCLASRSSLPKILHPLPFIKSTYARFWPSGFPSATIQTPSPAAAHSCCNHVHVPSSKEGDEPPLAARGASDRRGSGASVRGRQLEGYSAAPAIAPHSWWGHLRVSWWGHLRVSGWGHLRVLRLRCCDRDPIGHWWRRRRRCRGVGGELVRKGLARLDAVGDGHRALLLGLGMHHHQGLAG